MICSEEGHLQGGVHPTVVFPTLSLWAPLHVAPAHLVLGFLIWSLNVPISLHMYLVEATAAGI